MADDFLFVGQDGTDVFSLFSFAVGLEGIQPQTPAASCFSLGEIRFSKQSLKIFQAVTESTAQMSFSDRLKSRIQACYSQRFALEAARMECVRLFVSVCLGVSASVGQEARTNTPTMSIMQSSPNPHQFVYIIFKRPQKVLHKYTIFQTWKGPPS